MMIRFTVSLVLSAIFCAAAFGARDTQGDGLPLFTADDSVWVLFYDVSSRRFRTARDKFIKRDFEGARRDLMTSVGHLRIEGERASGELSAAIHRIADRISETAAALESTSVQARDLDQVYAEAHWLLAQASLDWARQARNEDQYAHAGAYLWAAAHHMERTTLWSNQRISRETRASLEEIRDIANRLREGPNSGEAFRERPVVRAHRVLLKIGKKLDLADPLIPTPRPPGARQRSSASGGSNTR